MPIHRAAIFRVWIHKDEGTGGPDNKDIMETVPWGNPHVDTS